APAYGVVGPGREIHKRGGRIKAAPSSGRNHMQMLTRRTLGLAGALLLLAGTSALAQAPVRVRGEITKVDGTTLSVKMRDGQNVTVKLAEPPRIAAMVKASMADIKEGTFIGVSA